MSAGDVLKGRITLRVRTSRGAEGQWLRAFLSEVRWIPSDLPEAGPWAPVHDGHYEIRTRRGDVLQAAYADLAASIVLDDLSASGTTTFDRALAETDGWPEVVAWQSRPRARG